MQPKNSQKKKVRKEKEKKKFKETDLYVKRSRKMR